MANDGTPFEQRVSANFTEHNIDYVRLYTPMTGLKGVNNVCDFVAYLYPHIFYIECKSDSATSFDMLNMIRENQWFGLIKKDKVPGTRAGYLVWMSKYNRLFWLSAFSANMYYTAGYKTLSIKHLESIGIEIPATKTSTSWVYGDIIRTILRGSVE